LPVAFHCAVHCGIFHCGIHFHFRDQSKSMSSTVIPPGIIGSTCSW
jgi:hypothetical protein